MILDELIRKSLPEKVNEQARQTLRLNEIRLRKNCPFCFTVAGQNVIYDYVVTKKDIEDCIKTLCKNSLHTYFDFINQGYIPCPSGYRVGLCGIAVLEKNNVINLSEITSINIRIPNSGIILPKDFMNNLPYAKSLLIYSPPNTGKTTFLRYAASVLSAPPNNKKVCVIDCKNEIYSEEIHKNLPIDFFVGYPKYTAIDIAIRNMSPEYLICDEVGLSDDPTPLINCKNAGISLICSAHANTLNELLNRKNIAEMHDLKTFGGYVGISIKNNKHHYTYTPYEATK